MSFSVPEKFRVKTGPMRSDSRYGNNGQFLIRTVKFKSALLCQASDGSGWEHVSVSIPARKNSTPSWEQMAFVKDLFWGEHDVVVQIHPPASEYVNNHAGCLHLWRKVGTNDFCERPPALLVGYL